MSRSLATGARGKRKRVLSGMRPTGRLHIGHYFGALSNWIKMQEEYDCFFFVADWHALTTDYADSSQIAQNTIEIATDWLAAGLDPKKCTMFVQSAVPDHAELHLLLSMVTPLGWLERVPTYKEQLENIKDKDLHTYGFLGYPLLQAADIVMYGDPRAQLVVPVGEDQVTHVELTREIARKFNFHFGLRVDKGAMTRPENASAVDILVATLANAAGGKGWQGAGSFSLADAERIEGQIRRIAAEAGLRNFVDNFTKLIDEHGVVRKFVQIRKELTEPAAMLTETPRIPGTDGRKMSKSYGNVIELSEGDESIHAKTKVMMTDPARKRRQDPGNPDVCPVFSWHKLFSPPETIAWSDQGCRTAGIGCIECKAAVADNLIRWIEPIRARRQDYESNPGLVGEVLAAGSKRAKKTAGKTMRRVREAVFGGTRPAKAGKSTVPKAQAAMGS